VPQLEVEAAAEEHARMMEAAKAAKAAAEAAEAEEHFAKWEAEAREEAEAEKKLTETNGASEAAAEEDAAKAKAADEAAAAKAAKAAEAAKAKAAEEAAAAKAAEEAAVAEAAAAKATKEAAKAKAAEEAAATEPTEQTHSANAGQSVEVSSDAPRTIKAVASMRFGADKEAMDEALSRRSPVAMGGRSIEGVMCYCPITYELVEKVHEHWSKAATHAAEAAAMAPDTATALALWSYYAFDGIAFARQHALPSFSADRLFGEGGARLCETVKG
jgi:hypothetical protein